MENKVIGMVVTLALVLTVGIPTAIYSGHAFAAVKYGVNGGNGGNGGICTTANCNANGQNATGGMAKNSENGAIGTNGASG